MGEAFGSNHLGHHFARSTGVRVEELCSTTMSHGNFVQMNLCPNKDQSAHDDNDVICLALLHHGNIPSSFAN